MMNDECKISDLDRHKICKVVQRFGDNGREHFNNTYISGRK